MLPHLILISILVFFSLPQNNKYRIPIDKQIIVIILWLFSGFRYFVGKDFGTYKIIFENPNHVGNLSLEPVWINIANFFRNNHLSSQAWFLFTSFIIIYLICFGIRKLSINFYLSVVLFVVGWFYFESMNVVRQYVAISILFAAFYLFLEKKYLLYIIAIFIAFQFHKSAIIMLPIIFLAKIKYPKWLMISAVIITFFTGDKLMLLILDFILELSGTLLGSYASYTLEKVRQMTTVNTGLLRVFYNLIAIGILFLSEKINKKHIYNYIYINLVVFSVLIYNVFMYVQPVMRLSWYMFIFIIVLIPYILKCFTLQSRLLIITVIVLVFCSFTIKNFTLEHYIYNFNFNLIN